MKRIVLLILLFVFLIFSSAIAGQSIPNWKSWPRYPDMPRISASLVASMVADGEKMFFVYGGYQGTEVICGSIFIPYNLVPPVGDGSKINVPDIPKDTLMVVY